MGDNGLQSIILYIFSRLNPTPPNDDNIRVCLGSSPSFRETHNELGAGQYCLMSLENNSVELCHVNGSRKSDE